MLATEISYKELLFNFPFRNNKAPVETSGYARAKQAV